MPLKYFLLDNAAASPDNNQRKRLVLPRVASLQTAWERCGGSTQRVPEQVFLAALSSRRKETSSYTLVPH